MQFYPGMHDFHFIPRVSFPETAESILPSKKHGSQASFPIVQLHLHQILRNGAYLFDTQKKIITKILVSIYPLYAVQGQNLTTERGVS